MVESEKKDTQIKYKPTECMPKAPETGDQWDEPLECFTNGCLNINFCNNVIGYTSGDTIAGTVDICLQERTFFKDLTIEFVGVERSFFDQNGAPMLQPYHREVAEIIRLLVLVSTFTAEFEPGQYTYPFNLYLPAWLPDSVKLKNESESEQFFVEYTVRAQFRTNKAEDMVVDARLPGKFKNVSRYRGSREIYIYQAFQQHPEVCIRKQLQCKMAGGIFGFGILGSQICLAELTLLQNEFFPGEQMQLKLDIDNTKCGTDIEKLVFKLIQNLSSRNSKTGKQTLNQTKLFGYKEPGLLAKKQQKGNFVFDIPLELYNSQPLPGLWLGSIFQITYTFEVELHFKNQQEFSIQIPLKILSSPQLVKADEEFRVPPEWNPWQCSQEPIYLYHEQDKVSSYFKNITVKSYRDWFKNAQVKCPILYSTDYEVAIPAPSHDNFEEEFDDFDADKIVVKIDQNKQNEQQIKQDNSMQDQALPQQQIDHQVESAQEIIVQEANNQQQPYQQEQQYYYDQQDNDGNYYPLQQDYQAEYNQEGGNYQQLQQNYGNDQQYHQFAGEQVNYNGYHQTYQQFEDQQVQQYSDNQAYQ